MARDPLEKETDVFNQMTQTMALNNQIMKDQVASLKSKKKSAPAKAVVKKKSAGPMPKVVQKKAPPAPGGSRPYKGNPAPGATVRPKAPPAPGASMRPKAPPAPGASMRPRYSGTPVPGTSSPYRSQAATSAAKPAAKPAARKFNDDNNPLNKKITFGGGKKLGYYAVLDKGAAKAASRTSAGIAGKSGKSVNQLFK